MQKKKILGIDLRVVDAGGLGFGGVEINFISAPEKNIIIVGHSDFEAHVIINCRNYFLFLIYCEHTMLPVSSAEVSIEFTVCRTRTSPELHASSRTSLQGPTL